MDTNKTVPSIALYRRVMAGFILQGDSLGAWCRRRNIRHHNAKSALMGSWDGPKGRALRTELIESSGITKSSSEAA